MKIKKTKMFKSKHSFCAQFHTKTGDSFFIYNHSLCPNKKYLIKIQNSKARVRNRECGRGGEDKHPKLGEQ